MPATIIKTLISAMGFCCPYAFFRAVRGRSHPQVAKRLGVSRETIKYWRRKVRRHITVCKGVDKCAFQRFGGEIPRLDLLSLRERITDPFI